MSHKAVRFRLIRLLPVSALGNVFLQLQKRFFFCCCLISVFILFPRFRVKSINQLLFLWDFIWGENTEKKNCFKTCLMTPSTLGDNQWHVGLMWWLTGFSNPGGQWVHLQTRLREKPFASQLMQTCLTRGLCPNFSPQVKMCERQLFIQSTWARPWVWNTLLDVKESTPVSFPSHCIKL